MIKIEDPENNEEHIVLAGIATHSLECLFPEIGEILKYEATAHFYYLFEINIINGY